MTNNAKVRINLESGEVDVEAPVEALDIVFEKIEAIVPKLVMYKDSRKSTEDRAEILEEVSDPAEILNNQDDVVVEEPKKRRKSSSKRETYKTVDLGLDAEQRQKFRDYYTQKQPKNQNDQILAIMDWLSKNAGIDSFSWDQINTGFQTVNARVPTKISSVLGNLVGKGMVTNAGKGQHELTHIGTDRVTHDLPLQEKPKA